MNHAIPNEVAEVTAGNDGKFYVLALDAEGKEIKVEVVPTGEFSQETEVPATVH